LTFAAGTANFANDLMRAWSGVNVLTISLSLWVKDISPAGDCTYRMGYIPREMEEAPFGILGEGGVDSDSDAVSSFF